VIRVRGYEGKDRPELLRLLGAQSQAHQFAYSFPDPDDPTTVAALVAEEDEKPVAVLTGRVMVEGFLTLDPAWREPPERWEAIKQLYRDGFLQMEAGGFKEVVACVPPHLRAYGRRLARELGFVYDARDRLFLSLARPDAEGAER